jgi:protein TonB
VDRRRRKRERWVFWLAVLISICIHLAGALLGLWWARSRPVPLPPPQQETRIRFIPPQPEATPAETPPDTPDVSDPVEDPLPIVEPPQPPPQPRVEPTPPPPEPEPEPEEREPADISYEEKRERMKELLQDWRKPSSPQRDSWETMPSVPKDAFAGGDLMFESRADVDWGPYGARIKRIVRSNWRIPVAAQIGMSGATRLHFYIACDGSIEELELIGPSGEMPLDVSAENAIALSNRLPPPPLPPEFCEERVGVSWVFFYNMDERDLRFWYREREMERRRQVNGTAR